MKLILKLVAVIGVAFALAGCAPDYAEEPLYSGPFDKELSDYMNKNLPKLNVVQGEKLYLDVHPMETKQNWFAVRVLIDGEIRTSWFADNDTTPGRGSYCSFSAMDEGAIEYSDADGYKIKAGRSCYQAKELADFIRAALIDSGQGGPFIATAPGSIRMF